MLGSELFPLKDILSMKNVRGFKCVPLIGETTEQLIYRLYERHHQCLCDIYMVLNQLNMC